MNDSHYQDALLSLKPFNTLNAATIATLFNSADTHLRSYDKPEIMHLQNEQCFYLDVILDGRFLVQKIDEEGNVLRIADFGNGSLLGAHLLFSETNVYPWTITADRTSHVLHIGKNALLTLCQNNTAFLSALMSVISDKVLVLANTIDAISLKSIREKLIDYIRYEYHLQKQNPIKLTLSKKDLAEKLGVQRTSLSRELNKMRQDGLLKFDAKSIYLKDGCF